MKSQRVLLGLLAVIAAGVVVIAVVLVLGVFDREHTDAWRDARDAARDDAQSFCEIEGTAEAFDSVEACVDELAGNKLEDWEKTHPDDVWE